MTYHISSGEISTGIISENNELYNPNGGVQYVYLDFDGENTAYINDDLNLSIDVSVEDSGLSQERINEITSQLNRQYADKNIIFVATVPEAEEYSTIYVGATNAFSSYGKFYGLAETNDTGNLNPSDNAFVLLDQSYSNAEIISVIAHETEHIVSGSIHNAEDPVYELGDYAMDVYLYSNNDRNYVQVICNSNGVFFTNRDWTPSFNDGATKVVVTVTNNSVNSNNYPYSYFSSIKIAYTGLTSDDGFLLEVGGSWTTTMYLNDWKTLFLSQPTFMVTTGIITNGYSITAEYYKDIPIADLSITTASLSRTALDTVRFDPSESFTYSFTIKNGGDLAAASSKVFIYVDGKKYAEISVPALAVGASKNCSYTFSADSLTNGNHSIYVQADGTGIINEYSETNNQFSAAEFIIEPATADLAIRSFAVLSVSGSELLAVDQDIKFSAQIENRSANKISTATTAALYYGDKLLKIFNIPSIGTEKTFDFSYTLPAGSCSVGKSEFKLILDSQNKCTEFNENNNSQIVSKEVKAPIDPDLKIKKITILNSDGTSEPHIDEAVKVTFEIENFIDGDISLGRSSVTTDLALFCNEMKVATLNVPKIEAGKTHSITCTIPGGLLLSHENLFSAILDSKNICRENNEENNKSEVLKTFLCDGADLTISEIFVNGVAYNEDSKTNPEWIASKVDNDISFTVVNNGNQSSQETIVRIMLEPYHDQNISQWRDIKIDALAPGASKNYTISTTAEEITMGQIVFEIDPYNTSHDKDLSDNSISTKTIYVREPDLYGANGFLTGIVNSNKWQNFDTSMYMTTDGESLDISYGETLYVACNLGIPTGTYAIKLYCDDTLIKSWDGKHYTGERWQFFEFSTSCLPVGHHKLRIYCDSSPTGTTYNDYGWEKRYWSTIDAVIEQSTPELTWEEPKSDLTITAAKLRYPDDLKNAHEITFTVKNEGSCEAYKSYHGNIACLYAGEKEIAKYFLPVIYAGEEKEFTFTLADDLLPEGENELKLQVQYYTPEWDKNPNNNTFEFLADIPVKKKSKIEISVAETKKSNNTVMIEADFSSSLSLVSKQYSIGLEEWKDYIQPIIVNKNSVVHFRAVDELGASSVKAHDVNDLITITPHNSQISAYSLSWAKTSDDASCIVEISLNAFQQVLQLKTSAPQIDFLNLSEKNYQWIVKFAGEKQAVSGNIASQRRDDTPQKIVAVADGNMDVFFANANGKWGAGYAAQHAGILNGWCGTNEQVTLAGKNKFADIFEGSSDANILVMTDDTNGDALFVDDIYTALPGTVAEQQARIAKIDEIRAGLGDDIVDMTSQRFAYIGDGVKIYGGLGNDTIWANNGNNTLFGDAGNDRLVGGANNDVIIGGIGNDSMHGGGGDDIFCFGNNWGEDTVEQLAGGSVTLWFESGSENNWNADTLTYTDGVNSVTVNGVGDVTLRFGADSSLPAGCFEDAASEKIFEDKNKGFLA